MHKFYLFILLLFTGTASFCQAGYPYQDIKLEKPSDYKETEPMALSAATFLLTTAFAEKDNDRASAIKFLTTWMTGAKDYSFYLKGVVEDIIDDRNLLSLYLAAMTKYSLENKTEAANPLTVEHNASKLVIAYCDDAKNNFKLKKKYRKVLEKNSL